MDNWSIHWRKNSFIVTFQGRLDVNDFLGAHDEWISDERSERVRYYLVDFRKVTEAPLSEVDYKVIASYAKVITMWTNRQAIYVGFVTSDEVIVNQIAKFRKVAEDSGQRLVRKVFCDMADAEAWAEASIQSAKK